MGPTSSFLESSEFTLSQWEEIGFRIEITGDGSPSLRLLQSQSPEFQDGEAMHHSGGACAETDLIYGTCIRQTLAAEKHPCFLVVGLGLGYIEMFIAKEALQNRSQVKNILSFESVPQLRQAFKRWVHGQSLSPAIQQTYDQAAAHVLRQTSGAQLSVADIQAFLQKHFPTTESIQGALHADYSYSERFHGILYDAFSSKTSPDLWEEDFLVSFLGQTAAPTCFLATYACKGSLKRALRKQNFQLQMQEGFQGKRNRISAHR